MQSRRHSILESSINVVSGLLIAFTISQLAYWCEPEIQRYVWKGFEWHISVGSNIIMTIILTIVSIIRGYAWRRHFNKIVIKEKSPRKRPIIKYKEKYK